MKSTIMVWNDHINAGKKYQTTFEFDPETKIVRVGNIRFTIDEFMDNMEESGYRFLVPATIPSTFGPDD